MFWINVWHIQLEMQISVIFDNLLPKYQIQEQFIKPHIKNIFNLNLI